MSKKSIRQNYIFNMAYQVFAIIVPFVTTPYVSRVLGSDGIGTYSYTYAMVCYFTMVSTLGAGTLGQRIVARVQDDSYKRSVEFWNIEIMRFVPSFIVLIVYYIYVIFIAENKTIALIQSLNIFAVIFDVAWFLQGMEEFKKTSIRNFFVKIASTICIFLFVKEKSDLPIYVFCIALTTLAGNLTMWSYIKKYIVKVKLNDLTPFKNFKDSLQLFFPTIAVNFYAAVDKTMIGWFSNSFENGYYEQTDKIINMSLMLIIALSGVMLPRISREFANNHKNVIKDYMYKTYRFLFFISFPLIFGLCSISSIFVPVFFGEGYEKVEILIYIMSCLFLLKGINSITGTQYLTATDQQKTYLHIVIIGGISNIVLNAVLIPRLASVGAATGTVISEVIMCIIGLGFVLKTKQLNLKPIFKSSGKYIIGSVIMFIITMAVKSLLLGTIDDILLLILLIITGFVTYFIILALLKESLIYDTLKIVISKIKK